MQTVERLIEIINAVENTKNICISMATGKEFDYEKYEKNWGNIMSDPELKTLLPDWLISNRYGSSYWGFIKSKFSTYSERRDFLMKEFDLILDQVKNSANQSNKEISEANFSENTVSIILQKEVFDHVKSLLKSGHYFNAVEESYKIVREKLKLITGEEQAHKGFKEDNYKVIFGNTPRNATEKDFFDGVKFLHMAIQNLRNEKAHIPAKELDKNLAIHYIVLASLAYDLINRKDVF